MKKEDLYPVLDDKLRERGYHEFPPGPFDNDGIETCFQKRFDDEIGKKYFITINKWAPLVHPHTGETFGPSYEGHVQFSTKETDNCIDLLFLSGWDIEELENHAEALFQTGLYRHYETWENA